MRRRATILASAPGYAEPPRLCISGCSLDTGNMGVSALAASMARIVDDNLPGASIYLFVGSQSAVTQPLVVHGRTIQLKVLNYRMSLSSGINSQLFYVLLLAVLHRVIPLPFVRRRILRSNQILSVLATATFVGDIHGGDSFSDLYGIAKFVLGVIPNIIALLLKKKLVLLPQTYGPYNSRFAKLLSMFILKRAHRILTRDAVQFGKLGSNGAWSSIRRKVEFCPDIAFMLEPRRPKVTRIEPSLGSIGKVPLFGINVNGLLYNEGDPEKSAFNLKLDYRKFLSDLIATLLDTTTVRIMIIPHVFGTGDHRDCDVPACEKLYRQTSGRAVDRVCVLRGEYDQNEIKAIIGDCDFVVGSRMHACIAALSQMVPAVGIAYSDKFKGVFESVGLGGMIVDAREHDTEAAIKKVIELFKKRAGYRRRMGNITTNAQKNISEIFVRMFQG